MISTKSLISELTEVPREWIFEYYLELKEKLTGQDLKIKSIFNPADKNPSLSIFYSNVSKCYRFKDFSTDKSGDAVTLVQTKCNLSSRGEAAHKIISDYNQYVLLNSDGGLRQFKVHSKYKVSYFETRKWNNLDEKYWMSYYIGSKLLEKYNVKPLSCYKMAKEEDGVMKELIIMGRHYIYGFFRKDGTLYKIYQPMVQESKFIKVKDYIQGTDQLTMRVPYLVICSSLKDVMDFMKLGYKNAEAVAPDSENTLIPEGVIRAYQGKYESICTLFDNDDPGIAAMQRYKEKYGIPYVHLNAEKDLSDSIKKYGVNKIREELSPLLIKKLKKNVLVV